MNIRLVIADDHALVRDGLASLLSGADDIELLATAADGRAAVSQALACVPDVVLMDIAMPLLNGLDACARIRRACPTTRVLALSMHSDHRYVRGALQAGASGYVLKNSGVATLLAAIRSIARGEHYLDPKLGCADAFDAARDASPLTSRQREILQLIAEGWSTREVASHLRLSAKTVETHRAQICERLQIRDTASLTRYAIRTGLVTPES